MFPTLLTHTAHRHLASTVAKHLFMTFRSCDQSGTHRSLSSHSLSTVWKQSLAVLAPLAKLLPGGIQAQRFLTEHFSYQQGANIFNKPVCKHRSYVLAGGISVQWLALKQYMHVVCKHIKKRTEHFVSSLSHPLILPRYCFSVMANGACWLLVQQSSLVLGPILVELMMRHVGCSVVGASSVASYYLLKTLKSAEPISSLVMKCSEPSCLVAKAPLHANYCRKTLLVRRPRTQNVISDDVRLSCIQIAPHHTNRGRNT